MEKISIKAMVLGLALVTFFSLTGCGNTASKVSPEATQGVPSASTKDALTVAIINEPPVLDPVKIDDPASSMVMASIYEGLVKFDSGMKIQPCLAESYEAVDKLTYRFHLKKGVKFHNGEEMKASDVVFSLKRLAETPLKKSVSNEIDVAGLKAEDDYTVIVKTLHAFSPILAYLTTDSYAIQSEKAVTEGGDKYLRNPVGTGPFKFVSWQSGQSIKLDRFDDYHDKANAAKVKTLTFRIIVEAANRVIELETGGVDIAQNIPSNSIKSLESNKDVTIYKKPGTQIYAVEFNETHKPFDNKLFRQALMYASDVQSVADVVWEGTAKAAVSPLAEPIPGYNPDVPKYPYDIVKAKSLLTQAGYPNGIDISISANEAADRGKICEILQAQWAKIGVRLTIKQMEVGAFTTHLASMSQDIFVAALSNRSNHADASLYFSFFSTNINGAGNFTAYNNKTVDQLLLDARQEQDATKANEIYKQIQSTIMDDAAWLPIAAPQVVVGTRSDVAGLNVLATNYQTYNSVFFK